MREPPEGVRKCPVNEGRRITSLADVELFNVQDLLYWKSSSRNKGTAERGDGKARELHIDV